MSNISAKQQYAQEIAEQLGKFRDDPLGFSLFAFPWGQKGSPLEHFDGPLAWQRQEMEDIRENLSFDHLTKRVTMSGHGIGKTAGLAQISLWALATFPGTKIVITANTQSQLESKTSVELMHWFNMFIGKEFFKATETRIMSVDPAWGKTWRLDLLPWSKDNPAAFAGLHNYGKRTVVIFDEACAIDGVIWDTVEGAFTDSNTQRLWLIYGNPLEATGRFAETELQPELGFSVKHIDSRDAEITDKTYYDNLVRIHGEDSNYVKSRIRGLLPDEFANHLFSNEILQNAARKEVVKGQEREPLIIGVDPAGMGEDHAVIWPRRGLDARSYPIQSYAKIDEWDLALEVEALYHTLNADHITVDVGGSGGAVGRFLLRKGLPVIQVDFGGSPFSPDGTKYKNKRSQIYHDFKSWLADGGAIHKKSPSEIDLPAEALMVEYAQHNREELLLKSKKDIKKDNDGKSPDHIDALVTTFTYPLTKKGKGTGQVGSTRYNPYNKQSNSNRRRR